MLSINEVRCVAALANLPLASGETPKFQKWLSEVLDYFKILDEVDTSTVSPAAQVTGLINIWREDQETTLSQGEALANAKKTKDGYFVTEKVL